eukprot:5629332-Pyramimonas_sp.AAC.1
MKFAHWLQKEAHEVKKHRAELRRLPAKSIMQKLVTSKADELDRDFTALLSSQELEYTIVQYSSTSDGRASSRAEALLLLLEAAADFHMRITGETT